MKTYRPFALAALLLTLVAVAPSRVMTFGGPHSVREPGTLLTLGLCLVTGARGLRKATAPSEVKNQLRRSRKAA